MRELLAAEIMDFISFSSVKIFMSIWRFILKMFIKIIFEKVLNTAELKGKQKTIHGQYSLDISLYSWTN